MKGLIYEISFDDKIYIGSTIQKINERVNTHHRAFTKYGFDYQNSNIEILEECEVDSQSELFKIEGKYIDACECVNISESIGLGSDKKTYDKQRYLKLQDKYKMNTIKNYYENHTLNKQKKKDKYNYVCSWGGDPRYNNNLLSIKL
tara:strand:- start:4401 stop:4838 length:438 start_codon:yes stop_codon:yes gene_type:complete